MIRINLLPEEYRKKERAPVQQPVVIGVCIALNVVLLGVWLWQALVVKPRAENDLAACRKHLQEMKSMAAAYDTLDNLVAAYARKEEALATLYKTRVEWGRMLYLLAQIVPDYVGLEKVELKRPPAVQRRTGRQKPTQVSPGVLDLDGLSAGGDVMLVGKFVDALMGKPPEDRTDILPQSMEFGRLVDSFTRKPTTFEEPDPKKYVETKAWKFGVTLTLAPAEERLSKKVPFAPVGVPVE